MNTTKKSMEVKISPLEDDNAMTKPVIEQANPRASQVMRHFLDEIEDEDYRDFVTRTLQSPNLRDYRYRSYQDKRDNWIKNQEGDWIKINNSFPTVVDGEDDTVAFGAETVVARFSYNTDGSPGVGRPVTINVKVKDALRGYDPFKSTKGRKIRWIHLPANNMSWVESLMKALFDDTELQDGGADSYDKVILQTKNWKGRSNSHDTGRLHARYMRPTAMELHPKNNSDPREVNTVFFMPYLHWENDLALLRMKYLVSNIDQEVKESRTSTDREALNPSLERNIRTSFREEEIPKLPCTTDEKLIRKYLHGASPLHLRRTLDQAFYHTLQNTDTRDRDQVVFRYARDRLPPGRAIPPLLMVDQCWIWVLGDTVVSSFPRCWKENDLPEDPLDVLQGLVSRLNNSYWLIKNPHDLASLIILHCTAHLLGRTIERDERSNHLHFFDWFHLSLRELKTKQTEHFEDFSDRSAQMQNALEKILVADKEHAEGKPRPHDYPSWKKEVDELQGPTKKGLFDISEEIAELKSIKDIMDELSIIEDVVKQQKRSLEFLEDLPNAGRDYKVFGLLKRLNRRKMNISALQEDATQVYRSIMDLLDLKQKQANVSEARLARSQTEHAAREAEETKNQGVSIMLFTTVTIIFLPISTIASIFGMNANELNGGNLSIGVVLAYLFPLSFLIIIVSFLLAFHRAARQFFAYCFEFFLTHLEEIIGYSQSMEKRMQSWDQRRYDLRVRRNSSTRMFAAALKGGSSGDDLVEKTNLERQATMNSHADVTIVTVEPRLGGSLAGQSGSAMAVERRRGFSRVRALFSWKGRSKSTSSDEEIENAQDV